MHCGNCARRIEDGVGTLEGVTRIRTDHQRDAVVVEHTPEVFESQIRAKLRQMGFDAAAHPEDPREKSS